MPIPTYTKPQVDARIAAAVAGVDLSGYVSLAGTQTISGAKTFSSTVAGVAGFSVPATIPTSVGQSLVISPSAGGDFAEPVWAIGVTGALSNGMGVRGNGKVQFLGGTSFGPYGELLVGDPSNRSEFGLQRSSAQSFALGNNLGDYDSYFTFNGYSVVNANTSYLAKTSTTNGVVHSVDERTWTDSTHATRRSQTDHFEFDAAGKRFTHRDVSDGIRGYFAFAYHDTAPDLSHMPNNLAILYGDGTDIYLIAKDSGGTVSTRIISSSAT